MPAEFYTRQGLAKECGVDVKTVDRHIRAGTARLNKAAEKIPGLGVQINGQLAAKFIAMMKAKAAGKAPVPAAPEPAAAA